MGRAVVLGAEQLHPGGAEVALQVLVHDVAQCVLVRRHTLAAQDSQNLMTPQPQNARLHARKAAGLLQHVRAQAPRMAACNACLRRSWPAMAMSHLQREDWGLYI